MSVNEIFPSWDDFAEKVSIVIAALTAALTISRKISRYFSDFTTKVRLRQDFELLKMASENSLDAILIKAKINDSISSLYRRRDKVALPSIPNIMAAIVTVGGFSWWTYSIYAERGVFSPWMLLTGMFAAVGVSVLFTREAPTQPKSMEKRKPIFAVYLYSWQSALIHLTIAISCIWGSFAILGHSGWSLWHFLLVPLGIVCILGIGHQFSVKTKRQFSSRNKVS